jgi:hypothetical protein
MSKTFNASADIPGYDVAIDLRKDKTKERDPKKICGSKHAVWIGIQPPPVGGPNKIIPFENSIVVAFWANDTSGGGILDPGAIIGGITVAATDPKKYRETVDKGQDIVIQNYEDCKKENGFWNCKGEFTEAVVFSGLNQTVGRAGSWVAAVPNSVNTIANHYGLWDSNEPEDEDDVWYDPRDWLDAEQKFATDFLGLDYHSAAAMTHKVSVEITCRQNGKTRVVHDTELSGTSEVYDGNKPLPALGYYTIDSPGEWKVRVKSIASGGCADPRLDVVETFTVAEPSTNSASSAENHTRQIIGPSGKTMKVSPTAIVMASSETVDNSSFNLNPPLVGLTASTLFYLAYRWWTKDERESWQQLSKKS